MIAYRLWQIAGWTMLHYFWVGAALGAMALLARQKLRSSAAGVRYLFALGSLALLSISPAMIAVVVVQNLAPLPHDVSLPIAPASHPEAMRFDEIQPTMAADVTLPAAASLPAAAANLPAEAAPTRNNEPLLRH